MTSKEKEQLEYIQNMILCIGFAAGAGFLPYSKAEAILAWVLESADSGTEENDDE